MSLSDNKWGLNYQQFSLWNGLFRFRMVNVSAKKGIKRGNWEQKMGFSMRRKWKNFNFMCWWNGDTHKVSELWRFFSFSHTQCDILFHFNSSAFPFLCFVLHFICEWAGWYCFYLIAYNTRKKFHEKEMMIFASEYFFFGICSCSFSTSFEPLSIISHC